MAKTNHQFSPIKRCLPSLNLFGTLPTCPVSLLKDVVVADWFARMKHKVAHRHFPFLFGKYRAENCDSLRQLLELASRAGTSNSWHFGQDKRRTAGLVTEKYIRLLVLSELRVQRLEKSYLRGTEVNS